MVANPVVILLLLNLVLVRGQLGPFVSPPERPNGASPDGNTNPVYDVGNPLNITWMPVNGTASLTIWQTLPNGSDIGGLQYLPSFSSVHKSYYFWDPIGVNGDDNQPDFDLAASNIFHFDLYKNGATFASGLSIWFNLTNDTVNAEGSIISTATSSVSLPASTGSSTTTTSSHASSPTSSLATSLTSSSSPSETSTGLSSGAKAVIGVVVALVVIAGIVGAFRWSQSKKSATVNGEQTANPYTDNPPNTTVWTYYKVEMDGTTPQQKPIESPRAEMVGSSQIGGPVELAPNRYY